MSGGPTPRWVFQMVLGEHLSDLDSWAALREEFGLIGAIEVFKDPIMGEPESFIEYPGIPRPRGRG